MQAALLLAISFPSAAVATSPADSIDPFLDSKARELVLTDIGNEPDDQMSLVRQLLYSNEIDLEGIVAVTSTHKKTLDEGSSAGWEQVIAGYEQVHGNLVKHDPEYPSAAQLRSIFSLGQPTYGLEAIGPAKELSAGARALIAATDRPEPRPLWVTAWGGANTLAAALDHVRRTRPAAELAAFVSKLRVYSISDQDDTGPWLRKEFPDLFWVVSPSLPDIASYPRATWTGISGEHFWRRGTVARGPDPTTVTHAWLKAHIQDKGPLGEAYPTYIVIMEGDTPSWLWLIRNGLAGHGNPSWGGWGGRYFYRNRTEGPTKETRPIFTNGSCAVWDVVPPVGFFPVGESSNPDCTVDDRSADTVTGFDQLPHTDDFATIYRWRNAFQQDFSNRMDWTIKDYADANHAPAAVVNGVKGVAPVVIDVRPGVPVTLTAAGSSDPDGNSLTYSWFHYKEAGRTLEASSPEVELSGTSGEKVTVTPKGTGLAHIILTATDNGGTQAGEPFPARAYRRVILNVSDSAPQTPETQPLQGQLPPTQTGQGAPQGQTPATPRGQAPTAAAGGSNRAAACPSPRLRVSLDQRPLRGTRLRPVVRAGRAYRYRIALRCVVAGRSGAAARGTVLYVTRPGRSGKRVTRGIALDRRGSARLRLRLRRSSRLVVRYVAAPGKGARARFAVRVRR